MDNGAGIQRAGRPAGAGARDQEALLKASTPNWQRYLRRALAVHDDERAWRRGAEGEEHVGRVLAKLNTDEWLVLHDLTLNAKGSNLDHLVIGPPGVFTLNTKHLTGKLWVGERRILHNGQKTDFLRTLRWEADMVAKLLRLPVEVPVRPILVLYGAELTVKQMPDDGRVMHARQTRRWLKAQTPRLDAGGLASIKAMACRRDTWL